MNIRNLFILVSLVASLLLGLSAHAQKLLKRPLQYVPADSVFVLPKGDHNVIMDIMAIAPFASPQPIVVTKADRKAAKHDLALGPGDDRPYDHLSVTDRTMYDARMLLLTGDSRYATLPEHAYFTSLPAALQDDGILPIAERQTAAQQLLDLTGTFLATDGKRDIYVNIFENCVSRVKMKKFRVLLDMISDYPDSPMVKIRIDGLDPSTADFALHIRVPAEGAPTAYYINGHEVIRPVYRDGYFVLDRRWRNGEEVYFLLGEI